MSPSATPATQSDGHCRQAPHLPRKVKVDVAKCHATQAKSPGVHGVNWDPSEPPASTGTQASHQSQPSAISATPATQSAGPCRQAPRLPCRMHVNVAKRHTCDAKCTSIWPSATPATQNARRCRQVPRLPRKQPRRPRRQLGPKRATRASPVPISATPASQSDGRCHQVPRLPRKVKVHEQVVCGQQ